MYDAIDAFDCLSEAVGIPQVSQDKIGVEMADLAIIARLADHQSGPIPL